LNARIGVVPEADIPSFSEESVTGSKNVLFNNNPEEEVVILKFE